MRLDSPSPSRRGFTLVELMLVVAIIAIISAMAIPALTSSRMAGNEASAVSSLRTLSRVNEQYRQRFSEYAPSMSDLVTQGYLDAIIGSGVKSGYDFSAYLGGGLIWTCSCVPVTPGGTGDRGFYVDQSGVIRFVSMGVAGPLDSPLD